MSDNDEDEDAFRWAGEDLTSRPAERPRVRNAKPQHDREVESTAEVDTILDIDADAEASEPNAPMASSLTLVSVGVLAGIYFLYTLGWLSYALRSVTRSSVDPLAAGMFNLGLALAVVATPLWFGLSFWFIRRASLRYAALVLGALLLIPIPLVWPR